MNQNLQENDENLYWEPQFSWCPTGRSKADIVRSWPEVKRKEFLSSLSDAEKARLHRHWSFWARPKQLPPPYNILPHQQGWQFWVLLAGRAFGKTRTAAEYTRYRIENGLSTRIALLGPTYGSVERTMLRGESGLLNVWSKDSEIQPKYVRSDNTIYFRKNKEVVAEAYVYTGEEPERLRGPQHDFAWIDELVAFQYLQEVWELFVAGLRLGESRAILTTTPKSNLLSIPGLLDSPRTVVTHGTTQENEINLSKGFMDMVHGVYKDSHLDAQELQGKLIMDESGALFRQSWINRNRIDKKYIAQFLHLLDPKNRKGNDNTYITRTVVAVDPSGSDKDTACECGIVVMGVGSDGYGYVLEDLSKRTSSDMWAKLAIDVANKWNASIVYEENYGGNMVPNLFRGQSKILNAKCPTLIAVKAAKDKHARGVPISALVSKNKIRFVGHFPDLERQCTTWTPEDSKSPDRLDAFVWAATHLFVKPEPARGNLVGFINF